LENGLNKGCAKSLAKHSKPATRTHTKRQKLQVFHHPVISRNDFTDVKIETAGHSQDVECAARDRAASGTDWTVSAKQTDLLLNDKDLNQ
jgi:hypothetical protein